MKKPFGPLEEIGLLKCYQAILSQIAACDDTEKQHIFAWGFWQITQQVQYPEVGAAIKAIVDNVVESPENLAALLPALRQVVEFSLADAEKRFQEEEYLADEKYSPSAA